jgi:hypothetical protein
MAGVAFDRPRGNFVCGRERQGTFHCVHSLALAATKIFIQVPGHRPQ